MDHRDYHLLHNISNDYRRWNTRNNICHCIYASKLLRKTFFDYSLPPTDFRRHLEFSLPERFLQTVSYQKIVWQLGVKSPVDPFFLAGQKGHTHCFPIFVTVLPRYPRSTYKNFRHHPEKQPGRCYNYRQSDFFLL